jgi:hypothetical protein
VIFTPRLRPCSKSLSRPAAVARFRQEENKLWKIRKFDWQHQLGILPLLAAGHDRVSLKLQNPGLFVIPSSKVQTGAKKCKWDWQPRGTAEETPRPTEEFRGLATEPLSSRRESRDPWSQTRQHLHKCGGRMWATRRMASNRTFTSPALTFELVARCSVSLLPPSVTPESPTRS